MSALSVSAVMALALIYGQPVAPKLITDQALVESGLDPLAIHDNTTGQSFHPADGAAALAQLAELDRRGDDFDAGLMQINRRNWAWLGLNATSAIDPTASIAAAARLYVAISRYNTGSPDRGFANGYVSKVLAAGRAVPAAPAQPSAPPIAAPATPGAPCSAPAWDTWALAACSAAGRAQTSFSTSKGPA